MTKLEAQKEQFAKALQKLEVVLKEPVNEIVRDSAIQRFEFTLDLAWKALKTFLLEKGGVVVASPKECFREAYKQGLLEYDADWVELVDLRNESVHTYNEEKAKEIYAKLPKALELFVKLQFLLDSK